MMAIEVNRRYLSKVSRPLVGAVHRTATGNKMSLYKRRDALASSHYSSSGLEKTRAPRTYTE